jgi:hypothetical protein
MELPDDVLQMVREYSKPWFKYHTLYKRILGLMGRKSCPELKKCLQFHPEHILPDLVAFEKANAEAMVARELFIPTNSTLVVYSNQKNYYAKRRNVNLVAEEVHRILYCRTDP